MTLALAMLMALATLVGMPGVAQAQEEDDPPTFDCEVPGGYLFQGTDGVSQAMGVNLVTGEFTTFNDDIWPAHTNAWGYNRTDGLMWGVEIGAATDTLLRVGSDWEVDEIEFDGDNTLAWVYSGDFDADGVLHAIGLTSSQTSRVDVNPDSENYGSPVLIIGH